MKILFRIILLNVLAISTSLAQVPVDSLSAKVLDQVVVTGQFEPQSASKSVYKIRTISMEKIQSKGATRLQDVLNTELNIRFSQDLSLGGSNLSMQGLAGQNVKVLIDGVPMVGRQGTSNEININQINVNSIERVEIIEGPMSVVYGADALAGVINIITRKGSNGKLDLTAKVQEETVGKEYGLHKGLHNESVGASYAWDKFNVHADLTRNDFDGWKGDSTGREMSWHPKTQWMASSVVAFRNENSNAYYRLDYLNENIHNPGNYGQGGNSPGIALDQDYITNRFMHQVQGGHKFNDHISFNTAIAYTDYSRKTQSVTVDEKTGLVRLSLGKSQQDVTEYDGLTVRGTLQYKVNDKLSFQPGFDINQESGQGGRIKEGVHSIGDYAFFLSGEWSITPHIQIRPGLRTIYNSVYQAPPVVPSLNTKFKINDKQDIRLSYARGFRAPSLRELYFSFFDASHAIEGNPDLEAELSHSFNGSWTWKLVDHESLKLNSSLGGFYNHLDNMIINLTRAGSTNTTYLNVEKFTTKGVTLTEAVNARRWDFNLGLGYTARANQYYETDNTSQPFVWSPEVTSSFTYRMPVQGVSFSAYYKYTGVTPSFVLLSNDTVGISKLPSFQWTDVSIQKSFFQHVSATVGVRNLFNITRLTTTGSNQTGAHSAGAITPIGYGRSYYLSISYSLNKL